MPGRGGAPADWLLVGLGNPGPEYERTRHNVGFEIARTLIDRWQLPKPKARYRGLLSEGRSGPGGPRVAVLQPQTYMNEAGQSVGPARGALKVDLDHVIVLHDEIDIPFGDIRVRLGGGLAGHNGLKSLKTGLGSAEFVLSGRPTPTCGRSSIRPPMPRSGSCWRGCPRLSQTLIVGA